jgi:hypothetical protein
MSPLSPDHPDIYPGEPLPGGEAYDPGDMSVAVLKSFDSKLELAHLLAIIESAARLLEENLADIDGKILRAHGAELAAGREWPGMAVRSTLLKVAESA